MYSIDEARGLLVVRDGADEKSYSLDTPEAFRIMSDLWLRAGWRVKHPYSFTWMGRPVIQLPEDLLRLQELIFRVNPDVIIETGVAHGGGLVFYASLCRMMGRGRVIGIDVDIRAHNRRAIESHPMSPLITLVEGDSVAPDVVAAVAAQIRPDERVIVLLDSNHSRVHVAAELCAYAPLVSPGSYVVAMDGYIMKLVVGGPRTSPDWTWNNARDAAAEFVAQHADYVLEDPPFLFNESSITEPVSYFTGGTIRRLR